MPSIGPQLPPHLQKRKRTPETEGGHPGPPPSKLARSAPRDGDSGSDDSNDDAYGPGAAGPLASRARPAPVPVPSAKLAIGPSLPPHLMNPTPEDGGGERADLPSLGRNKPLGPSSPSLPPTAPAPARRVMGPTLPPAPLDERPTAGPGRDDSDSDSDGYGPALPSSSSLRPNSRRDRPAAFNTAGTHDSYGAPSAAPTRDDWMVAPPTATGPRAPADPTQLRSRKFASGRAARPAGAGDGGISSMWTETADEKRRRLADAVLGRGGGGVDGGGLGPSAGGGGGGYNGSSKTSVWPDGPDRVRSYVEQTRGRSLLEEHVAARREGKVPGASARDRDRDRGRESGRRAGEPKKGGGGERDSDGAPVEEEDDPSRRVFDKEKDIKVGGQISGAQRREFLARAADFGGRFKTGKYL